MTDLSIFDGLVAPVFPLPEVVLFPGARLPLHVFEPRYRAMLADCLATPERAMVIAPLRPGFDAEGQPAIPEVACVGVVVEHRLLPDGRSTLVLEGRARVRLHEQPFVPPYRRARLELLPDGPGDPAPAKLAGLVALATGFVTAVRKLDATFDFALPETSDASRLADLCAFHLVVDGATRQALLEERNVVDRLDRLVDVLGAQRLALARERPTMLN